MKKYLFLLVFPAVVSGLAGCHAGADSFVKKIEDPENGLRVERQTANYKYSLQYCPYDYLYIREQKGKNLNPEGYEARKSKLEGLQYFVLSIEDVSGKKVFDRSSKNFNGVYDYYSSYFEYSISFSCDGNEIPPGLFHTEGLYGINNAIKIHMGFDGICDGNGDWKLTFLNELDQPQPIQLSLSKSDINDRPEFKF